MAGEGERLFIALFLDENVDERLGSALRRYGFDVQTTQEAGRKGSTDEDQLAYAARQGRAILSHNIADFVKLHKEWMTQGKSHWGILLTSTTKFRALLRKTLNFLDRFTAEEVRNECRFL